MLRILIRSFLLVSICFISLSMFSQEYILDREQSYIKVLGTSSLHDWKVDVQNFSGQLIFDDYADQIADLKIRITSKSLKGNKKAMNKKIYKALRSDTFETIKFISSDSQIVEEINKNELSLRLKGSLILAGETKDVQLIVNFKQSSDNIMLDGEMKLNMRDYNIAPPKALFGTVKVNEIVHITFETIYKQ